MPNVSLIIARYLLDYCVVMVCTSCTFFALFPLLFDAGHRVLPLKCWLPFEPTDSTFRLIYAWNTYFLYVGSILSAATDNIIFSFIIHGSAQFEILALRLRGVVGLVKAARAAGKDSARRNGDEVLQLERELFDGFIKHHKKIIRYTQFCASVTRVFCFEV